MMFDYKERHPEQSRQKSSVENKVKKTKPVEPSPQTLQRKPLSPSAQFSLQCFMEPDKSMRGLDERSAAAFELGGAPVVERNETGIPDDMKRRFENLSGFSFDDVQVHYNSDKPAQLQALAYTQGNQVFVGPGQEKHLPHELGHVVQQKQGIVKPTTYINGKTPVNANAQMESEASLIGQKAVQKVSSVPLFDRVPVSSPDTIQRQTEISYTGKNIEYSDIGGRKHTDRVGVKTEAYLDPSDKKKGSGTGTKTGVYVTFNQVQGHLLNADLGGRAYSENMFPISTELNKSHSGIEEQIKTLYSFIENENDENDENERLYYCNTVWGNDHEFTSRNDLNNSTGFLCEYGPENGSHTTIELRNPRYHAMPGTIGNEERFSLEEIKKQVSESSPEAMYSKLNKLKVSAYEFRNYVVQNPAQLTQSEIDAFIEILNGFIG